jgi:acetyl esterase
MDYTIEDSVVVGAGGDIRVRDYRPASPATPMPFLWVHGGGFVSGGLDQKESDAPARYLAAAGRWVRTVDYRLAPNPGLFREPKLGAAPGRFPAAHHDVLAVAAELRREAGAPITLGGASAGANIAAGVVIAMRASGDELPSGLVLAYGAFHSVMPENESIESSLHGLIARWAFNSAMVRRIALNYIGDEQLLSDPRAFPGGQDLHGFPPTFTLDATNDRLRRSGHAFSEELRAAGVPNDELVVEGRHGFLNQSRRPAFATGMAAMRDWLDRNERS